MRVRGEALRTIRLAADGWSVEVIDQRLLPHELVFLRLTSLQDAATAITDMTVRGAPLIGATAAYGICLALREDPTADLPVINARLLATRPTAVNLRWALDRLHAALAPLATEARPAAAYALAGTLCDEDVAQNRAIGTHGLALLQHLWRGKREHAGRGSAPQRLDILTHCNAGWLATVDGGTALAPVYRAHDAGLPVHVWVDETRPRNQGAALTAWELGAHGVPHTLIVDNAGGHLMQRGLVDVCLVGSDRTTARGDVCNKIGTYLKALAARAHGVPFYACVPSASIDFSEADGLAIPIEERSPIEVLSVRGRTERGELVEVAIAPAGTPVANPAFDVTPAALITGLITERGVCAASADGLASLFPATPSAATQRR